MDGAALADVRKVGNGNNVQHAPDVIRAFSLRDDAELLADPRMRAVSAKHVLSVDDLPALWRVGKLALLVAGELAVEAVLELVSELLWCGVLVSEFPDADGDGVGGLVLDFGFVDDEGLGNDGPLDFEGVVGKLVDGVCKPLLDTALVDDGAVEARDADDALDLAGDFVDVAICVWLVVARFCGLLGSCEVSAVALCANI